MVWRMSKFVLLRSQARQEAFWIVRLSPAPTEPSLMECDHMYCVCHSHPRVKERCNDACSALKLLFASLVLTPNWPNCGNGRFFVTGSRRLTGRDVNSLCPALP